MEKELKKFEIFQKNILKEIEWQKKVNSYSFKEMADVLIQKTYQREKIGTESCAVLNRVIEMLFKMEEFQKNSQRNEY